MKISGKLEFFSERNMTYAVVRDLHSRGSIDKCLAISAGDELTIKNQNGDVIFQTECVIPNQDLMRKHFSAVLVPQGVSYPEWMEWLRSGLHAELIKHPYRSS